MTAKAGNPEVADAVQPADATPASDTAGSTIDLTDVTLIPATQRSEFESRWQEIQVRFVDEPRSAVDDAEALVAEVVDAVTAGFAERKAALDQRWENDAATEELRQSLRGYREFFQRLLQI
jgi:hypothetical protein